MYSKIRLGEPTTVQAAVKSSVTISDSYFGPGTTALLHIYLDAAVTAPFFIRPVGSSGTVSAVPIRPGESIQYGPIEKADIPEIYAPVAGDVTYQFSSVLAEG